MRYIGTVYDNDNDMRPMRAEFGSLRAAVKWVRRGVEESYINSAKGYIEEEGAEGGPRPLRTYVNQDGRAVGLS